MELYDVMRTTFAARRFTDDDLPDAVLERIVDNARFAPSGGNRQGWKLIALRDRDLRRELTRLILPTWQRYMVQARRGESPCNSIDAGPVSAEEMAATGIDEHALAWIVDAPVALVVCLDLGVTASFDADLPRVGVISGASVYPLAWNVLLAARNEGYGGTLTTFLAPAEQQTRALLGIPDTWAVAALLPLGRPVQQRTRLKRAPVGTILVRERFDGAPIGPTS